MRTEETQIRRDLNIVFSVQVKSRGQSQISKDLKWGTPGIDLKLDALKQRIFLLKRLENPYYRWNICVPPKFLC